MKIVIQTGNHVGRDDLDYFISTIPSEWKALLGTIVVYGSNEEMLQITYHKKERLLGIHCSSSYSGSKFDVLEEAAIGLAAVCDLGYVPGKLSSSRRKEYKALWVDAQNR